MANRCMFCGEECGPGGGKGLAYEIGKKFVCGGCATTLKRMVESS